MAATAKNRRVYEEAEELKARAKLHDAHSFVGYKLVATMARSIQQTPSPAAALHTAGHLSALLKEMKRGACSKSVESLQQASESLSEKLGSEVAEAAVRELVEG